MTTSITAALRLLVVASLAYAAWALTAHGAAPTVRASYLCYGAATTPAGRFTATTRTLADAFVQGRFRVRRLAGLCNPAQQNQDPPPSETTALVGYDVKGPLHGRFVRSTHTAVDQFGSHPLLLLRPSRLLVPSAKGTTGTTTDPGPPNDRTLDHYQCYAVKPPKGAPRFAPRAVQLTDPFGAATYRLRRISRLCAPVNATGDDVAAPEHAQHLVCYQAKRKKGSGRFAARTLPIDNAAFRFAVVKAKAPFELCVPSGRDAPLTTPECRGECGNQVLQGECQESCECATAADTSCSGAFIQTPAGSPACRRCVDCRIDDTACEVVTTTTQVPVTTTPTTTGTTSTSVSTTTTPACAGTCGDQAIECEEECECQAADATSCAGAFIGIPAGSPSCRACRGCRIDDGACTTTTTSSSSTTSTTMPMRPMFVRSLGEAHDARESTATLVTIPSPGVGAGDSIIATFAMDPIDGPVACSDSRGNAYTVDVDINVGLASNGIRTVVCAAHGVTPLVPGNQVIVHHPLVKAKALSVSEFKGVDMLDRTATGWDRSKLPTSGLTETTTASDELLVSAIGIEAANTSVFTQGSGFTPLPVSRNPSSGGQVRPCMFPGYRIVSAMGSFQTTGTLNLGRRWAAGIATYKKGVPSTTTSTSSTSSSSTSSTSSTSTSSTSSTTLPFTKLAFTTTPGTTSCGPPTLGTPPAPPLSGELDSDAACTTKLKNLGLGCLYVGGGNNTIVPPNRIPDASTSYFGISGTNLVADAGTGPTTCTKGAGPGRHCIASTNTGMVCTSDAECGGLAGSCALDANCFFGPPVPIPNPTFQTLSTCVVNVIQTNAGGTFDAGSGDATVSMPLSSRVFLTANFTAPCPLCVAGTCNAGPRVNLACTAVGSLGTSFDCPPAAIGFQAPLPVTLAPLTTGAATMGVSNGLFCPEQIHAGAFGVTGARCVKETGSPAGSLIDGASHPAALGAAFCIAKTGAAAVDTVTDLPGPGAVGLKGTVQLLP